MIQNFKKNIMTTNAFPILLFTSFLSTLSSGILWTGFPVFLSTSQHANLSVTYAFATFGSLIFGLVGGVWSDIGNCKRISVISQALSFLFILAIYLTWNQFETKSVVFALPFLYFNFALMNIAELVWILKLSESALKTKILDRTIVTFLAKIVGFSIGPVFFESFESFGLLTCALLFGAVAFIQYLLPDLGHSVVSNFSVSTQSILRLTKSPAFVCAAFLTGFLSIPMNPIFVEQILRIGSSDDASLFWFLAGVAGLVNLGVQRFDFMKKSYAHIALSTIVSVVCLGLAFTIDNIPTLLIVTTVYVFCSVHFSTQLILHLGEESVRGALGSSFGFLNLLLDFGVFSGMVFGWTIDNLSIWQPVSILIFLLIGRGAASAFLFRNEKSISAKLFQETKL